MAGFLRVAHFANHTPRITGTRFGPNRSPAFEDDLPTSPTSSTIAATDARRGTWCRQGQAWPASSMQITTSWPTRPRPDQRDHMVGLMVGQMSAERLNQKKLLSFQSPAFSRSPDLSDHPSKNHPSPLQQSTEAWSTMAITVFCVDTPGPTTMSRGLLPIETTLVIRIALRRIDGQQGRFDQLSPFNVGAKTCSGLTPQGNAAISQLGRTQVLRLLRTPTVLIPCLLISPA